MKKFEFERVLAWEEEKPIREQVQTEILAFDARKFAADLRKNPSPEMIEEAAVAIENLKQAWAIDEVEIQNMERESARDKEFIAVLQDEVEWLRQIRNELLKPWWKRGKGKNGG